MSKIMINVRAQQAVRNGLLRFDTETKNFEVLNENGDWEIIRFFPIDGGALTGTFIRRDVSDSSITIRGGDAAVGYSGEIVCFGGNYTTESFRAAVSLRVGLGDIGKYIALNATRNGDLRWKDQDITLGFPNYSAGIAVSSAVFVNGYVSEFDGWVLLSTENTDTEATVYINEAFVGKVTSKSTLLAPLKYGDNLKIENMVTDVNAIHFPIR